MKILILNQCFHPDVVSTAQHAGDLAKALVEAGHSVTVYASRRAYDDPTTTFPQRESWSGIQIERIPATGFGKRSLWRRLLDFASFTAGAALKLAVAPKFDVVVALTSPPLIAFLAALLVRVKGGKLLYWVMDLNPDQALAAGLLRPDNLSARVLEFMLRFALRTASRVVALDRFMQARILRRGIDPQKIVILPPWSHDGAVEYNPDGARRFRERHGLEGKFVVMYSGNHSPCHPLDTLLKAAERLELDREIVFCFVGGGSEHKRIREYARATRRPNILCLPYQPLDALSDSLSAANLQAVVMGDAYVGIVHPCKVYNILTLGIPVLYIGPTASHVSDLASEASAQWLYRAEHGEVEAVARNIAAAKERNLTALEVERLASRAFSERSLIPLFIAEMEAIGPAWLGQIEISPAETAGAREEECSKI